MSSLVRAQYDIVRHRTVLRRLFGGSVHKLCARSFHWGSERRGDSREAELPAHDVDCGSGLDPVVVHPFLDYITGLPPIHHHILS